MIRDFFNSLRNFLREEPLVALLSGAVGLLIAFMLGFGVLNAFHVNEVTCTVTDKDRTTKSEGGSDMRVYTEDCGTLAVSDSLLDWHFSSSDTYASIESGNTYNFTTRGFRIPMLSMFPNVVEVNG